jgi:hypothetical protein
VRDVGQLTGPSIFVGIPKIAQKKMNESELELHSIRINETTPTSYRMTIDSTIRTDGKIHAKIDGFTASMYLEDTDDKTPFTAIDFPPTTADKESKVQVSQHIDITNMDAFTKFNTWLLANETLRVTIVGETKVHVKGLSKGYKVNYKKTKELKGRHHQENLLFRFPNLLTQTCRPPRF